ncbi:MAG: hypothetical protein CVV42_08070 [Candidatus Riflebacteria bacterium HGW-Riflebacteria-2]|jgi:hypothetical protein|nr:MAG: hypothetical protein CVV42_08070 [Candidatus Riflebacteria bacterium HGW-Riflebacteria-2]
MTDQAQDHPQRAAAPFPWAKAFAIVGVCAILTAGSLTWYFFLKVTPTAMLIPSLSEEMTRGQFSSYVGGLQGQNNLQVASLHTKEEFAYISEKKLFHYMPGGIVEVAARVPCQITYHVQLKDSEWSFYIRDQGRRLIVVAPTISFNRPAIDLAHYDLRVIKDSMIRDSEEVKLALQNEIPGLLEEVGRKNIDSIRDTARISIKNFLEQWLFNSFGDKQIITPVVDRVYFADEEHLFKNIIFADTPSAGNRY